MVALHRILHPETTCLLWPVHIGSLVVVLERFHCIVYNISSFSVFSLLCTLINTAYNTLIIILLEVCMSLSFLLILVSLPNEKYIRVSIFEAKKSIIIIN